MQMQSFVAVLVAACVAAPGLQAQTGSRYGMGYGMGPGQGGPGYGMMAPQGDAPQGWGWFAPHGGMGWGMGPGWGAPGEHPDWDDMPHWGMVPGWGGGMPGWGGGMPGPGMMHGWGGTPGWGGGFGPGPMMPGRGGFAQVDRDQNGTVTAEEAADHAEAVFSALDLDDDGGLTPDEYMATRMGWGGGFNPAAEEARQARKKARFDPMDGDGDGVVTRAEFIAVAREHFEAADKDGNGVSPWEFRAQVWN